MFDLFAITIWIIESFILGLLITNKCFSDKSNQLLFAPIFGISAVFIIGNMLWCWGVPTYLIKYLFFLFLFIGIQQLFQCRAFLINKLSFGVSLGALVIIFFSIAMPYQEKVFQAYPLDGLTYLGASILFQKYDLNYFTTALNSINSGGSLNAWLLNPSFPMGLSESKLRPASEIAFVIFSWPFPMELHRLGNDWQIFARILQFISIVAILFNLTKEKFSSCLISLVITLGFWAQYTKDFNAWSSAFTLAITISAVAYLISLSIDKSTSLKSRFVIYFLILAGIINYPELGIPSAICIIFLSITNKELRAILFKSKFVYLEFLCLIGSIFLIHPYIFAFIKRQFILSPFMIGGEEHQGRNIFRLFSLIPERREFIQFITKSPFKIFTDPAAIPDMITGIFGFPYVSYIGAPIVLLLTALTILVFGCASLKKVWLLSTYNILLKYYWVTIALVVLILIPIIAFPFYPELRYSNSTSYSDLILNSYIYKSYNLYLPTLRLNFFTSFLLGYFLFFIFTLGVLDNRSKSIQLLASALFFYSAFFFSCILFNLIGGVYRTLPYWGMFGSIAFISALWTSNQKILKSFSVIFLAFHLIFGLSIFYTSNKMGMENYADWYSNSTALRHTEIPTVKDKYNYNYLPLVDKLRHCKVVLINMPSEDTRASRFHEVNLLLFLENNNIPTYINMPYRNATPLLGDPIFPGFKPEDLYADCEVGEEIKDGKLSYKLIQKRWPK